MRPEPELLEEARPVGRQRHRGADLAQLGGLFVDVDAEAVPAQCDGEGQTADAGADDGDAGALVVCIWGAAAVRASGYLIALWTTRPSTTVRTERNVLIASSGTLAASK